MSGEKLYKETLYSSANIIQIWLIEKKNNGRFFNAPEKPYKGNEWISVYLFIWCFWIETLFILVLHFK